MFSFTRLICNWWIETQAHHSNLSIKTNLTKTNQALHQVVMMSSERWINKTINLNTKFQGPNKLSKPGCPRKEDGTGGWGSALQCRDTTTVLRSTQRLWLSAQGQPSPTCSMDGRAVCSPGPSPRWEVLALDGCCGRENHSLSRTLPLARFLCKWLGPGPRTYGQG